MAPIEIISIAVVLGIYLAPVSFLASRYGTFLGVLAGVGMVGILTFALSLRQLTLVHTESYKVLQASAAWYNASVMSNVAESEEINKYLNP